MTKVCYNKSIDLPRIISPQGRFSSPRKEATVEEKLKKLKKFLTPEENYFYKPGDFISSEEIEVILECPCTMRKYLMPGMPPGARKNNSNLYRYSAELKCNKCGEKILFENITKNQLLERISSKRRWVICDTCKQEEKIERNYRIKKTQREREQFLQTLLDPNNSFKPGIKPWKKYGILRASLPFFKEDFTKYAEELKALPYSDFLKTPYWDAVSQRVRQQCNYMCSLCGSKSTLNVHHKTYIHHGYEVYHLEDLICLCRECHSKFHGKEIE